MTDTTTIVVQRRPAVADVSRVLVATDACDCHIDVAECDSINVLGFGLCNDELGSAAEVIGLEFVFPGLER